jgi:hypothetical protein
VSKKEDNIEIDTLKRTEIRLAMDQVSNHLHTVVLYLALEKYEEALESTNKSISEMSNLVELLTGVVFSHHLADGEVVVVPHGTKVVSSEDVGVEIPKGNVQVVSTSDVKEGHEDEGHTTE